jgi:hypothetical protein
MGTPATYPLEWVRGTTPTLFFIMKRNGTPLPFDDIRLSVYKNKGKELAFRATLADGDFAVVDPAEGKVKVTLTAEQTRVCTKTKDDGIALNKYELEYRDGTNERVYLMGDVSAIGGINDDEGDEVS